MYQLRKGKAEKDQQAEVGMIVSKAIEKEVGNRREITSSMVARAEAKYDLYSEYADAYKFALANMQAKQSVGVGLSCYGPGLAAASMGHYVGYSRCPYCGR